jgi:hypothetical protein
VEIHTKAFQVEKDRQKYGFMLVVSCDVQTFQYVQAVEFIEVLTNGTPELCCTMPGLESKPKADIKIGYLKPRKRYALRIRYNILGTPDSPKGALEEATR